VPSLVLEPCNNEQKIQKGRDEWENVWEGVPPLTREGEGPWGLPREKLKKCSKMVVSGVSLECLSNNFCWQNFIKIFLKIYVITFTQCRQEIGIVTIPRLKY
jgi:hypothetical protein